MTPYKMGDLELPNRIIMAAMTRNRCNPADSVPNDLLAEYYSSRVTSGFMFTESSAVSK
jgi:N-ethylmaleimide reductase